jgi:hypothetical protein
MPDPVTDFADRLVREANERARAAEAASREQTRHVPPRGWESARSDEEDAGITPDLAAIMAVLEAVRGTVPAELSTQLAEAVRELLLALRALIDWYIDRLESVTKARSAAEKPVEDIPIS